MQANIRESDILCRWGGEEFLLVLPYTDANKALAMAQRLRQMVADTVFCGDKPITISGGVAVYVAGLSRHEWIKRADEALYEAKNSGRNQIVVY